MKSSQAGGVRQNVGGPQLLVKPYLRLGMKQPCSLPVDGLGKSSERQSEAPGVPPQAFEPWRDHRVLASMTS